MEVILLAPQADSPAADARENDLVSLPAAAVPAASHPRTPPGGVSSTAIPVAGIEGLHVEPAAASGVRWRAPVWLALAGMLAAGAAGYFAASRAGTATPATATLLVETAPPGARVIIDGTLRGETPLRVDVSPGTQRMAVELPSGRREAELPLGAGTDSERPAQRAGILEVKTQPPGANVMVAGKSRGKTPVTIRDLSPGLHDVLISAAGRSVRRQVNIAAGQVASLTVPMTASEPAAFGSLTVTSTLPFRIEEGGRVLGSTDGGRPQLSGGRHELEFVNDDYGLRLARTVQIVPGRDAEVTLTVPPSRVSVNATPWAEVFADGQRLGETPIGNVLLPVGPHELVFRHPQLGERRQTIHVRAGAPTRVTVDLAR